jgi:hypothetical protein
MGDAGSRGDGWNGFGEAEWRRLVDACRARAAAPGPEGLAALADAYRHFAAQFASALGAASAADPQGRENYATTLQALTRRFLESLAPMPPPPTAAPPAWIEAFLTWTTIIGDLARATATAFAGRLARPDAPTTLRGLFDAWIDCAESAYQTEAHSERYARVQATLFNEAVALRARQQALLEQASRAIGVPGRREVDALHDAVRELRAELDATRSGREASAAPARGARPSPARRSAKAGTPSTATRPLGPKRQSGAKAKSKAKPKPKPKPELAAKPARPSASRRTAKPRRAR